MAGLKKTKTGAGDKTRAYIIRQNTMMKVILSIIVALGLVSVLLFSSKSHWALENAPQMTSGA